mgnify:CR=1 FL=1
MKHHEAIVLILSTTFCTEQLVFESDASAPAHVFGYQKEINRVDQIIHSWRCGLGEANEGKLVSRLREGPAP